MHSDPLHGPRLKTEWAKQHIGEVNASLFHFAKAHKVRTYLDANGTEEVEELFFSGHVPERVVMWSSYALHDLRSALDHVACIISTAPKSEKAAFVIADTDLKFEAEIKKREERKQLSPDASRFIRGFKPYQRDNLLLWALHRLNVIDKHRTLITTAVYALTDPLKRDRLTTTISVRRLAWMPLNERVEIARYEVGCKSEPQTQFSIGIAFGEIEALKYEPIFSLLDAIARHVTEIINLARQEFFPGSRPELLEPYPPWFQITANMDGVPLG